MKDKLFIGVDVGTTTVKAAAYNIFGQLKSYKTIDNEILRPQLGRSEQSMDDVWARVMSVLMAVCSDIDANSVMSIGVCGQGDGLWALDADNLPIGNAILWNDQRSNQNVVKWLNNGVSEKLSRYCRTDNWPGSSGSILNWLKVNEPQKYANIKTILFCKDWINFKLTGKLNTDFSEATIPFLDLETRSYAKHTFELLDIPEIYGKLPTPKAANSKTGLLTETVAKEIGLKAGLPIAVGAIDLASMMHGMGLSKQGDVSLVLGTTAVVSVIITPEKFTKKPAGATLAHPTSGNWIRVVAPQSGAFSVDWFAKLHPMTLEGKDIHEQAYKYNAMASSSPAGANGVMFLPFLAGERAPFVAPFATASFIGLSSESTKNDMARAVLEGSAFSLRQCYNSTGLAQPNKVLLTGGGARNKFWCDIVANILGCTVVATDESDHGLWGAALLGGQATNDPDLLEFSIREENTRHHKPNPELINLYNELFEIYEETVDLSKAIWSALKKRKIN